MSQISNSNMEEEFEILLGRYLWDDLGQDEKRRMLELLSQEEKFRELFQECARIETILEGAHVKTVPDVGGDNNRAAVEQINSEGEFTETGKRHKIWPFLLAATLLLTAGGSLFILRNDLRFTTADSVAVVEGKCSSSGKNISAGDTIKNDTITSDPESICDIQYEGNFRALVRILPDSEIRSFRRNNSLFIFLNRGSVLIETERMGHDENLLVVNEGKIIRFLGTKVLIHRKGMQTLKVEVAEGRVEVKRSNLYHMQGILPLLSEEKRNSLIEKHPGFFADRQTVLEAGEYLTVEEKSEDLMKNRQFFSTLAEKISGKSSEDDIFGEIEKGLREIDQDEFKSLNSDTYSFSSGKIVKSRLERIRNAIHTREIIQPAEEKINFKRGVVNPRSEAPKGLQKVQGLHEHRPYSIYLKNGKVLQGWVFREGEIYIINTGKERLKIPRSDIKRIEGE